MVRCGLVAQIAALLMALAVAQAAEDWELPADAVARWGGRPIVVLATLERADPGPVAQSFPPVYMYTFHLLVEEALRGPFGAGERLEASHSVRQAGRPVFPIGKRCVVALSDVRGRYVVGDIEEAGDALADKARLACAVPLGWRMADGKLLSPWASLGANAWPATAELKAPFRCAVTGRPALLAGRGIRLEVEPVPPAREIQWTNPDGDGEFRVTVRNEGDLAADVPALIHDGENVLWGESLVILCQDVAYPVPGSGGVRGKAVATRLEAGQSVSTVINALALRGPEWPRGGYRIEFQFCLGELSRTVSFYYMSRHHDALRKKAQAGLRD